MHIAEKMSWSIFSNKSIKTIDIEKNQWNDYASQIFRTKTCTEVVLDAAGQLELSWKIRAIVWSEVCVCVCVCVCVRARTCKKRMRVRACFSVSQMNRLQIITART